MPDNIARVTIGSLLHDIGKIIYRSGDHRTHSASGYEFVKEIFQDKEVLGCIQFHHAKDLSDSNIGKSSLAYITYIADNISSGTDRRESEEKEAGFDTQIPLASIFNILNNNDDKYAYEEGTLEFQNGISFPKDNAKQYDTSFYNSLVQGIKDGLKSVSLTEKHINSVLELLEGYLTYIPSSTSKKEIPDISLFDHSKTTAAIAACIYNYLKEKDIDDYKTLLFDNAKDFYNEKCFLLLSCDMSGIQDFIYTISGEKALKALRARSFYLEIMTEHIVDEIIEKSGLSRANLIYSGGGHAYILMPNTNETKNILQDMEQSINKWFLENFKTSLYIATAYSECSGNDLMNNPAGSYKGIYSMISSIMSEKKLKRYNAVDIAMLNNQKNTQSERECKECKITDKLNENDICQICDFLKALSNDIVRAKYFVVSNAEDQKSLILPNGRFVYPVSEDKPIETIKSDNVVRFYSKNKMYTGLGLATKLWMADYVSSGDFAELAKSAVGIERIAVLRADVDDLGRAFVSGFKHDKFGEKYITLSRTATLSRQLSLFFKYHMNYILKNPQFRLKDNGKTARNATVVYSGGDDMFIVGSWNDCLELAIDVSDAFAKYTQKTLSISAGLGMFEHSYPIARMAYETGGLESRAKNVDEKKDKIALFDEEQVYHWDELKNKVIGEKFSVIKNFFDNSSDRGKAFIYKLLDYIRNIDEKINIARLAYLLARLEPDKKDEKEKYSEFTKKIYAWALESDESRNQLKTALYLYVYLEREKEAKSNV